MNWGIMLVFTQSDDFGRLGMKDIKQVDVAADLALRFRGIDLSKCRSSILDQVLTSTEKSVLECLLDRSAGPFAKIWSSGEFRWDGVAEAQKHWALVESLEAKEKSQERK